MLPGFHHPEYCGVIMRLTEERGYKFSLAVFERRSCQAFQKLW